MTVPEPAPLITGRMMNPDLTKLRRFSLTIALLLITYSLAIIELPDKISLSFLGAGAKVDSDWLPIGLMLASLYSIFQFYFYGVLLSVTPWKARRILRTSCAVSDISFLMDSPKLLGKAGDVIRSDIAKYFPGVSFSAGFRLTHTGYEMEFTVPETTKTTLYGGIRNVDYAAPIWLNAIALGFPFIRLVQGWF